MKKKHIYFLGFSVLILAASQLFIYSADLKTEDELHQQHFNMKYGILKVFLNHFLYAELAIELADFITKSGL